MFETISHGSASGRKSPESTNHQNRSHVPNQSAASSSRSHQVDEAYRRLGQRLSLQAHGDVAAYRQQRPVFIKLQRSLYSSFTPFRLQKALFHSDGAPHSKVAKMRYSDHGDHHSKKKDSRQSVLRKLIYQGKEFYNQWQQNTRQREAAISPQRYAFSMLALETIDYNHNTNTPQSNSNWAAPPDRRTKMLGGQAPPAKGLLSAVLEGHSDSNTSAPAPAPERYGSPNLSISTKDSRTVQSSIAVDSQVSQPPRGPCLTSPSEPVANDGLDNIDGNLIVHENDVIIVPRKSLHSVIRDDTTLRSAEFRVQKLLGQGTFAQVFQCLHVQTGEVVAVKIVKNKPAYTRQAAIEIDVFRALLERVDGEDGQPANRDFTVNLICYFMHRSHLCLVFELLGMNLYEVLKKRQFRGLPLTLVQTIVKQSIEGIRDLSQKSIVHCDLKPENILLVSSDVENAVVSAGEARLYHHRANDANGGKESAPDSSSTIISGVSKATSGGFSSGSSTKTTPITNRPRAGIENPPAPRNIKLIDFGSACFEGYTAHIYIQSRFYRSPEVLIGLPYDSSIDMWSLGCVAAELFLGLPILPGVHEHDQLGRIEEMVTKIPDWMLDQGSKTTKYYVKFLSRPVSSDTSVSPGPPPSVRTPSPVTSSTSPAPSLPQWRIKSQKEYISSLSESEIRKKGGVAKLEKQPGNRYFKKKGLADILLLHGQNLNLMNDDKKLLSAFIHFLYGLLDPDPWKRWTAFQAAHHPFVTGDLSTLRPRSSAMAMDPKETNLANLELEYHWQPPWDPAICRRKLLNVQKMRERQQAARKSMSTRSQGSDSVGVVSQNDRRNSRKSDQASGVQGMRYSVESSSPPNELHSHSRSKYTPSSIGAPSSWTNIPQPSISSRLATDSSEVTEGEPGNLRRGLPVLSQPQSFTGIGYERNRGPNEGDFAYALQRPGVVPGTGPDSGMSMSSQSVYSLQAPSIQPTSYCSSAFTTERSGNNQIPAGAYTAEKSTQMFPQFSSEPGIAIQNHYGANGNNIYGVAGSAKMPPSMGPATDQTNGGQFMFTNPLNPASVSSSITSPEFQQNPNISAMPYIDPSQLTMFHRQHGEETYMSQNYMPPNPSQRGQETYMHQNHMPPNPSQPFPFQQQPVFLAQSSGPGGGYFYVTTSANGQPIILQPVAYLNQTNIMEQRNYGDPNIGTSANLYSHQFVGGQSQGYSQYQDSGMWQNQLDQHYHPAHNNYANFTERGPNQNPLQQQNSAQYGYPQIHPQDNDNRRMPSSSRRQKSHNRPGTSM